MRPNDEPKASSFGLVRLGRTCSRVGVGTGDFVRGMGGVTGLGRDASPGPHRRIELVAHHLGTLG